MKLLVFSDSHGVTDSMLYLIKREKPDGVIHCGDHKKDADMIRRKCRDLNVYSVVGNCDYYADGETELLFTLCGKRFYITHGHLHGIKRDYTRLIYAAMEYGADVIICGHTHIPLYEVIDGMHLINPGSITFGKHGYGIIEMDDDSFTYTPKN